MLLICSVLQWVFPGEKRDSRFESYTTVIESIEISLNSYQCGRSPQRPTGMAPSLHICISNSCYWRPLVMISLFLWQNVLISRWRSIMRETGAMLPISLPHWRTMPCVGAMIAPWAVLISAIPAQQWPCTRATWISRHTQNSGTTQQVASAHWWFQPSPLRTTETTPLLLRMSWVRRNAAARWPCMVSWVLHLHCSLAMILYQACISILDVCDHSQPCHLSEIVSFIAGERLKAKTQRVNSFPFLWTLFPHPSVSRFRAHGSSPIQQCS